MAEPAGPLDRTLARVTGASARGIQLVAVRRADANDEWIPAPEIARAGGPLDAMVAGAARQAGTPLATVGAQWLLERYAWQLGALTAATLVDDARVPDLAPERIVLGCWEGLPWGVGLRGERLYGVDDDPDAGAGVTGVGSEPVLVAHARRGLVDHLRPLVGALVALRLRPQRALWRTAGDRVAQGFLWAGAAFEREPRAERLARQLLEAPSPLRVEVRFGAGRDGERVHLRSSCCLNHRVGRTLCAGCPLVHLRERPD